MHPNVKLKTTKLEENKEENNYGPGFSKYSLDMTPKAQSIKICIN